MKTFPGAAAACAIPAAAGTLAVLAFIVAEALGSTPFSPGWPRNIAEAAATGHSGEVLRLLWQGEDPTRIQPVRPELAPLGLTRLSANEAAVLRGEVELVMLLDRHGTIVGEDARRALACLARASTGEVVRYFALDDGSCDPDLVRARLAERGR